MKTTRFSTLFHTVGKAFHRCLLRFPMAVCFIVALTVYLLLMTSYTEPFQERRFVVWGYYLSVGSLLSLSIHLWAEEVKNCRTRNIVQIVFHLLLVADALFLYYQMAGTRFVEIAIAHAAALLALGLSVFFLPFFREKNDIPAWNFAQYAIGTLAVVALVAGVMCGGLSLLAFSLQQLFSVEVGHKCYLYILILCGVLLPSLLFLGLLPEGEAKHDRTPQPTPFLDGVVHYLFLPLVGCYLVVLYVYACTIIARWELPDGWVSWLVVTLMTGCIAIEFALYPARIKYAKRADEWAALLLPGIALPLLLLMSIGIARRFMDYGITINRLYLGTLNVWFYFVCIGLLATRARRLSWIPISFSVAFLLTSVLPVNYASITRNTLRTEVRKALAGKTLPLSEEEYKAWMMSLPTEQAGQISSKLAYLQDWYGEESANDLIDFRQDKVETEIATLEHDVLNYEQPVGKQVELPQGYKYCTLVVLDGSAVSIKGGQIFLPFRDSKDTLVIRLEDLRPLAAGKAQSPPVLHTVKGHPFVPTSFRIRIWDNGKGNATVRGYRFENSELITQKCD